jgi:hypothetical protein
MIEAAREVRPFVKADEVLAYDGRWAVVANATDTILIVCRIRRPAEKDSILTVRIDALRRYGDLCWIRGDGSLWHMDRYADAGLAKDSRAWRIVKRLWPYLARGEIPASVTIFPDEFFERGRSRAFQVKYPEVWRRLISAGPYKRFNDSKLELVRRFGDLTDAERATIMAQKTKPKAVIERLPDNFDDF